MATPGRRRSKRDANAAAPPGERAMVDKSSGDQLWVWSVVIHAAGLRLPFDQTQAGRRRARRQIMAVHFGGQLDDAAFEMKQMRKPVMDGPRNAPAGHRANISSNTGTTQGDMQIVINAAPKVKAPTALRKRQALRTISVGAERSPAQRELITGRNRGQWQTENPRKYAFPRRRGSDGRCGGACIPLSMRPLGDNLAERWARRRRSSSLTSLTGFGKPTTP